MNEKDLDMVLSWRNSDRVRLNMFSTRVIAEEEHRNWYYNLDWRTCQYLVFEYRQRPVGLVNFTEIDRYNDRCGWGFTSGKPTCPRGRVF
jgi:RimJ/RimL family protein N-acetyltransferase